MLLLERIFGHLASVLELEELSEKIVILIDVPGCRLGLLPRCALGRRGLVR